VKKNLADLTIAEFADGYARGEWTSEEATGAVLDRIEKVEEKVHAFVCVDREGALEAARKADAGGPAAGEGPLRGAPLAIKDNLCTTDLPTTCSSRILEGFRAPYEATVVRRLRESGAVIVGKTNMDEFAMGSSTEHSAFGATRNPWDTATIPGGSSGGSAAAVSAGECLGALGSDTGGSIRQPASHCGVSGLKPTYGRVSRYGLVAFASSLDQIGPLAKSVEDCALLLDAVGGHDGRDSTSAPEEMPGFHRALLERGDLSGLRVGILGEHLGEGLDPDVRNAVTAAVGELEKLGAATRDVNLPHAKYAVAAYYIIATAEASSNLARYDGVKYGFRAPAAGGLFEQYRKTRREGFGAEVKRRIMLGTYALSSGYYDAYYRKAQQVRTLIAEDYRRAFDDVDVLVGPTAPTPAFPIGEKADDPLQMYLSDVYTISVNLAGVCRFPAASAAGAPWACRSSAPSSARKTCWRPGISFRP
jgi:aspartyl-tRNA(Asn)/glutamyl-tRNA(Gln) amidotransferase subunit A